MLYMQTEVNANFEELMLFMSEVFFDSLVFFSLFLFQRCFLSACVQFFGKVITLIIIC